jgi:hypothetical protein
MTHSHAATETATATSTAARALRVVSTLAVVFIVLQGVTAGEILSRSKVALSLHFTGAIVVHVFTGLTLIAAFLVMRQGSAPRWPTVLSVVVFIVGFVQAAVGEAGILAVHVPLAMLLLVGAVAVMLSSFWPTRA